MKLRDLDQTALNTLGEVCNIGAGHAATSLAKMVSNLPIRLNVPQVRVVMIPDLPDLVGGAERFVGAVLCEIEGSLKGSFLVLFDEESSRAIIGLLMRKKPEAIDFHDPMVVSTLAEVGNILSSSFLGALSQMTQSRLLPSIPSTAFDMAGAVLDNILAQLGTVGDEGLFIEIEMSADEKHFSGHLFIIPDPSTLNHFKL